MTTRGPQYSIKVYKQYFNFSAAHFLIFPDGTREPLHGHNYLVKVRGDGEELKNDMLFDFLDIKPIVKELCDQLDHLLLIPEENSLLSITAGPMEGLLQLSLPQGLPLMIPREDILRLPLPNISAERLAIYMTKEISIRVLERHDYRFHKLSVEVEEAPGQSAQYELYSSGEEGDS